jgi:ABC-2 type transport system permease protein
MSFDLLKQTLKDKAKGAVIAAAVLFLLMFYISYLYPQVMNTSLETMLSNPAIQALIGKTASMATFEGFLTIEGFSYMGLIIGGYFAFLTASFLAGEIETKTIDLLMSLPVKRENVVLWRYVSLVPIVILVSLAILLGVYAGAKMVGITTDIQWVALDVAYIALLGLSLGAISLFVSAVLNDGKQAALLSLGIMILTYFIETIGSTMNGLGFIQNLSPFHYVNNSDILVAHQVSLTNAAVLIVVLIVFLALAVLAFGRRDINVT